jgi:glutathione synthase/RimK-type ligase-like ATP-grasp enzyme
MALPKRLTRKRWAAIALSRLGPLIAPRRTALRVVDDSSDLDIASPLVVGWPVGSVLPRVGLVEDAAADPYWTKYRRFMQNNLIPFRMVDVHGDSWLSQLADLDLLVWRPGAQLSELEEARRKVFHMTEFMGLATYPSLRAVTLFNDKILGSWALQSAGVECPRTVASFAEADALEQVAALGPEVVWKTAAGSGSSGVERLSARRARVAVRRSFSTRGRRTYWPYANQKGYAYAQTLERDLATDMRIIVVGPLLFGYYRDTPKGEFRASGMGLVRHEGLPPEAMEEAWQISEHLGVGAVAVDFITDVALGRRKVIEFSSYIRVDDPEELRVDGVPGVYVRERPGTFTFRQGRLWFPEVALAEVLCRTMGLDVARLLADAVQAPVAPEAQK